MTKIEWTETTWNPLRGCSRVSRGCEHCYAEKMAHRFSGPGQPYDGLTTPSGRWTGEVRLVVAKLDEPLRWRKPRLVFVNSMSDLFHENVPFERIAAIFGVMAACPQHTFQILTKRPERASEFFVWAEDRAVEVTPHDPPVTATGLCQMMARRRCSHIGLRRVTDPPWPLPHVWVGVTVEDQDTADHRIPLLLNCPAAVRWVSYEPALGPLDFSPWSYGVCVEHDASMGGPGIAHCMGHDADWLPRHLDWIVVGGESGPGARPFDLAWARDVIAQGKESGTRVFLKQIGSRAVCRRPRAPMVPYTTRHRKGGDPSEWPEDLRVREMPS